MWNLAVSIVFLQICLITSKNDFQNTFSQNYTYKTFHTYSYEFGNLPHLREETIIRRPVVGNVPAELPAFLQEQLRRQNIPIKTSQNSPQTYNFSPDNHKLNQHQGRQNNFPSPLQEDLSQVSDNVPQPNLINKQGTQGSFRKSREDNPTPVQPSTSTPLPTVTPINSSSCYYGFCENVVNYPEEAIKRLLSNNSAFEAFFRPKVPDITERFNNDFENLCTVTKSRLFPKKATNLLGKEKIVINIDGRTQAVDSEICREDAMCRFTEYWPIGYKGKCVQKYVQIPLAVMDENSQNIVTDIFSYPSGCYCACKSE